MEFLFKIAVLTLLALILLSLGSGMFFLTRDDSKGKRTVTALTLRIGLSLTLFVLLLVGYFAGWIQPHGLEAAAQVR